MEMTFAFYGLAAVAALALSLIKGRRHPSVRISLMLLTFWGIANLTPAWIDPWMDACGFYVTAASWFGRPRCRWCMVITAAFLAQMLVHVAFIGAQTSYWRLASLNLLFAVQLIAVAFPGGIRGLRYIRDRCVSRHRAGPLASVARDSQER